MRTATPLVLPCSPFTHLLYTHNIISKSINFTTFTSTPSSSLHCNFNTIFHQNEYGIRNRPLFHSLCKSIILPLHCSLNQDAAGENLPQDQRNKGFWGKWKVNSAEMRVKLAKLGLAAILAYGIFDGITYTSFFVMAFLGYEKSTGKNPAANLQALLGIIILMWTGNNITRPFRVAGAAALAPVIDRGLKKIENYFRFPSLVYAFALVVSIVAALCSTVVGLLILSRWGR